MPRAAPERRRSWLLGAGLLVAGCATAPPPPPVAGGPLETVNAARNRGCGAPAPAPLRADPRLDAVAVRLAEGLRLADAVAAERYPAARSASIRVSRAADAGTVYGLLTTRFCEDVADPEFGVLGSTRRGEDLWIVLASPFQPPEVRDSATTARRALALVNEARAQARRCGNERYAPAPPLVLDITLGSVAELHARDMARHGRMSHEGSDGSTPAQRLTRAGYVWRTVAENVAAGDTSADAVMRTWLASPGHCANLMNPDVREMGIAWAFEPSSPKGTYWAQVFATRR